MSNSFNRDDNIDYKVNTTYTEPKKNSITLVKNNFYIVSISLILLFGLATGFYFLQLQSKEQSPLTKAPTTDQQQIREKIQQLEARIITLEKQNQALLKEIQSLQEAYKNLSTYP